MIKKLFFLIALLWGGLVVFAEITPSKGDTISVSERVFTSNIASKINKKLLEIDKKYTYSKKQFTETSSFTFAGIQAEFPIRDAENENRKKAKAAFKKIVEENKWIDRFINPEALVFPVGIEKKVAGTTYQVGFTKASFGKDVTELTVYVKIKLPHNDAQGEPIELFFGADKVKLSHDGGLVGEFNLVLLGDVFIPFNSGKWMLALKGGIDMQTGAFEKKSFATINCDGVKEFGLQGEVQFSRSLLIPLTKEGLKAPEKTSFTRSNGSTEQIENRVKGAFSIVASDWNDLLVEVDITPFALAKHPDKFVFEVNKAIFDFSDQRTPEINFPAIYTEESLLQPSVESWRGVYIESFEISLPKVIKTKESAAQNKRVHFAAYNLLLDDHGISGTFKGENIFSRDSGTTSKEKGWAYSLDVFEVTLEKSKLKKALLSGEMVLPISKNVAVSSASESEKNPESLNLKYSGFISNDEYVITVSNTNKIDFDIWKAKATLLENSYVELKVEDDNFRPKAVLNGSLDFGGDDSETTETTPSKNKVSELIDFKGIEFQNLSLQTVSPIITVGSFGYTGSVGNLSNFPVSISDIEVDLGDSKASLTFDLSVALMENSDKGVSATTRLEIKAKVDSNLSRQKWKFDKINLKKILIDADLGAVKLSGELELLKNDPVYGNGFSAELQGTFGKIKPLKLKAIFGKKDFKYWYVDAAINGLDISLGGGMKITGFTGGASYHMTRKSGISPTEFSPSGLSYVPSSNSGLGVKAMVLGAIGDEKAVSLGAGFEIEFNRNFGMNRTGLFGEVKIMNVMSFDNPLGAMQAQLKGMVDSKALHKVANNKIGKKYLDKSKEEYPDSGAVKAAIEGKIGIEYDFVNSSFHAEMTLYINSTGGVIKGTGPGGLAGWAVAHVDPNDWYLHIGTPSRRIGIELNLGSLSLKNTGYFMAGTKLEGSPPPPIQVANILGVSQEKLDSNRNENLLKNGGGFAFGYDFRMDTGDIRFLMFYARFQAGFGFDIMLRDLQETRCANRGGKQIGIDGWYANGQAYAYLQGELGIKVKLFFKKRKIPIIETSAAVLLQAKAPNPIWIRGYLGGRYRLLGGLVKGSFRMKLEVGEECDIINDGTTPIQGLEMISDITPGNKSNEVDVFAAPQATFTYGVNTPIRVKESGEIKTYKIVLEEYRLAKTDGTALIGELEWSADKDRVTFFSKELLPSEENLTITCRVSFQEYINGSYRTIENEGAKVVESRIQTFRTGKAPTYIPLHNVAYCYPIIDQQFVLPEEHNKGYIKLKRGQSYLFDDAQWETLVSMNTDEQDNHTVEMAYSNAENMIVYTIPNDLEKEKNYTMSIASFPKNSSTQASNTGGGSKEIVQEIGEGNSFVLTQKLSENISVEGAIERLTYKYRTSKYRTLADKIDKLRVSGHAWYRTEQTSTGIRLNTNLHKYEGFGLNDLIGSEYSLNTPLISVEATLTDSYFNNLINPLIYGPFGPTQQVTITRRNHDKYGFIPKKAVLVSAYYLTGVEHGSDLEDRQRHFPWYYNLTNVYLKDYNELSIKAANVHIDNIQLSQPQKTILSTIFPFMTSENYEIKMKYTLPGDIQSKANGSNYNYYNPIK